MKIHVKEVNTVKPAEETPRRVLWNSKLDLLVPKIHLPSVYFYERPVDAVEFFDGAVVKEALSKALVPFYPIAGRLRHNEHDNNIEIDCNGEGVLVVEAKTDVSIAHFGDFTPTTELLTLIPAVDYSRGISSFPILVVQVTHFKCGGVSLGLGMHHFVGDGFSCITFVNTWSDMARGLDLKSPPFIDRTLLRARDPPRPVFDHVEYARPPPLKTEAPTENAVAAASFKITREQVNALKVNSAAPAGVKPFSSFEVLTAHIWRCVCMARSLPDDQDSKLHIAAGGRSRLDPPLPVGYFGNVVFSATPIAQVGDILSEPPRHVAAMIRNSLVRLDNEYLRSAIDFVELEPDVSVLSRGPHTYKSPNLGVTTWVGLPIHEADFGWGRPVYMGPAACVIEGIVFMLPSPAKDGSLSVLICLQKPHLKVFEKLLYDI